jgi:hypothetical protein
MASVDTPSRETISLSHKLLKGIKKILPATFFRVVDPDPEFESGSRPGFKCKNEWENVLFGNFLSSFFKL